MKFDDKTLKILAAVLVVAVLAGGGLNTLISWEWDEMTELRQVPKGSVIDIAQITENYNVRLMGLGYQLKNASKFSSMKPSVKEIEFFRYLDGTAYIQMKLSDGAVIVQKYGVSSEKGDYVNNIAFHIGGVGGCVDTTVGKTTQMSEYRICSEAQGVGVLINRNRETTSYSAPACTDGKVREETCYDGSKVVSANCVSGAWVNTYKTCQAAPIVSPTKPTTQPQCTNGDKSVLGCSDGSEITEANCVDNHWVATGATCADGSAGIDLTGGDASAADSGATSDAQANAEIQFSQMMAEINKLVASVGGCFSALLLGGLGLGIAYMMTRRRVFA